MKILIATPCNMGMVTQEYSNCLLTQAFCNPDRLANQDKYELALYQTSGVSGLGRDRSVIATYALRNNFDKLMFIDSDQAWEWVDIRTLVDSEHLIIAGVVPLKAYPLILNFQPLMDDRECFEDEDNCITPKGLRRFRKKHSDKPELEVELTGTGFMCIDVRVLRKLAETSEPFWFHNPSGDTPKMLCWDFFATGPLSKVYMSDDWGFCVQAKRAGYKVHINSTVFLDHIGRHCYRIDPNEVFEDFENAI